MGHHNGAFIGIDTSKWAMPLRSRRRVVAERFAFSAKSTPRKRLQLCSREWPVWVTFRPDRAHCRSAVCALRARSACGRTLNTSPLQVSLISKRHTTLGPYASIMMGVRAAAEDPMLRERLCRIFAASAERRKR